MSLNRISARRSDESEAACRSGVFTQASVRPFRSYPTRTSPVLRGKYLLETVLNYPTPPPPPDVPALDEKAAGVARSMRRQMEAHRAEPLCASCHSKMDVLGFGLENYDAIGRWRITDGRFPIDATGAFPNGRMFNGPAAMKAALRDNLPDFIRVLSEKYSPMHWAAGWGEQRPNLALDEVIRVTAAGDNRRFQSLIVGIVQSLPFQQRHAPMVD